MKHEIVAKRRVYDGFVKLDELSLRYERFDGDTTAVIEREIIGRRPAVAAVLFDPERQTLVFVEQFRVGAQAWLLELVAGVIEAGDDPETTLRREIKEETGLEAGPVALLHEFYSSPGFLDEYVYLYAAIVDSTEAEGIYGVAGEHEDIRVHCFTVDQARQHLASGRFNNAFTLIGMNHFFANQARFESLAN